MSDSHAGFVITLGETVHGTDAERILDAIRMIKGVVGVTPVTDSLDLCIAEQRADEVWRKRIVGLLKAS